MFGFAYPGSLTLAILYINALPDVLGTLWATDRFVLDLLGVDILEFDLTGVLRLLPCAVLSTGAHAASLQ